LARCPQTVATTIEVHFVGDQGTIASVRTGSVAVMAEPGGLPIHGTSRKEHNMKMVTIVGTLLLLAGVAHAGDPATAFQGFCDHWIQMLQTREQTNATHIHWHTDAQGVLGSYVGYSREHRCVTKTGTGSVPIGEIMYDEVQYEKRGSSIAEARKSSPHAVDTTAVTEIFRYSKGKWVY
jgi:hypothetical protein